MRRNLFLTIAFALLAATSWGQEHTPANEAEARQMVSDVEPLNLRRCAPKEALKIGCQKFDSLFK